MHRWRECPGSVRLSEGVKETRSIYAQEGTDAHSLAEALLKGEEWKDSKPRDKEFFDAVGVYVDLITDEVLNLKYGKSAIEKSFHHPDFHPDFYGTCDAIAYDSKQKLLRVYDYKHGKGHRVYAEENPQLLSYALGGLLEFKVEVEALELIICQPRASKTPVDRWRTSFERLMDFAVEWLEAARRTEQDSLTLKAGDYCFFCPAVSFCPEKHKERNAKAREQFSAVDN